MGKVTGELKLSILRNYSQNPDMVGVVETRGASQRLSPTCVGEAGGGDG